MNSAGCTTSTASAAPSSGTRWARAGRGRASTGTEVDHAAAAADGWAEIARRLAEQRHDFYVLDEFTYPLKWGWVDVDEVIATLDSAARHPARRDHRPRRAAAAARRRRPGHRDDQGQTPDGRRAARARRASSGDSRFSASDRRMHSISRRVGVQTRSSTRVGTGVGVSVPAVVIAAPASGSGKTTVATGLMGALRRAGHRVGAVQGRARTSSTPATTRWRRGGRAATWTPVLVGERTDRPAVPAWQRRRRHRGRSRA